MSLPKKVLISVFILFNFLTMVRVHVPLETKLFSALFRPVDSYLSFFSFYQDWFMFAPNPSRMNVVVSADVEFDDGTVDTFVFNPLEERSMSQKYVNGEKLRKIVSEGIRNDSHAWMWKDAAKFAVRKLKDKHFDKIPLRVHLIRHWNETPELSAEFIPQEAPPRAKDSYRFYTYEVI